MKKLINEIREEMTAAGEFVAFGPVEGLIKESALLGIVRDLRSVLEHAHRIGVAEQLPAACSLLHAHIMTACDPGGCLNRRVVPIFKLDQITPLFNQPSIFADGVAPNVDISKVAQNITATNTQT